MEIAVKEIKNVIAIMYFTKERSPCPKKNMDAKNTSITIREFIPNIVLSLSLNTGPSSLTGMESLILVNPTIIKTYKTINIIVPIGLE